MPIGAIISATYVTAILLAVVVVARILDNWRMRELLKNPRPGRPSSAARSTPSQN